MFSGAGCKPTVSASLQLCQPHEHSHVFLCPAAVWYDWHTAALKQGIYVDEVHYELRKILIITKGIGYRESACQVRAVTSLCRL
jgi:hypothetical protein